MDKPHRLPDDVKRERFCATISPHLPALAQFVRLRLSSLKARGARLPGDPTAHELVDAVVLQAYGEFGPDAEGAHFSRRLIRIAERQMRGAARVPRRRPRRSSGLASPPDTR